MNNIWIYVVEQQSKGIVIADSEYEAIEKVVESYKKHDDDICPAYVQVVKATETDGWKSDYPDMLEVVSFM